MNKKRLIFSLAAFFIPFLIYIRTLAPSLYFIDTGELATVCVKLGIAHPTGYPLFTLLGHIFTFIPIGDYIYRLNLMCALLASLTTMLFFNLLYYIFSEVNLHPGESKSLLIKNENLINVISLSGTLILAFSSTFWNTSNSLEVYALHSFFIVAVIYTLLKASNLYLNGKDSLVHWILFSFVLGLSFTNHLSTIFLSIGCLYLYFSTTGFKKESFKRILIIAIPFLIALSLYIYFFIRGDNPVIAWGNPVNWDNFYRHISGKQFSVWMFTSTASASKQFSHFTSIYPSEFYYLPLILAVLGIINIFIKQRKLFYFTGLLFVFNILYAINYDIHDIDTYFLLSFIITALWASAGLLFIADRVKNINVMLGICILVPALSIYGNFKENDLSQSHYVNEYTENVFSSLKYNSIIVSTQWDFWVSPSFYYQYVYNFRPDVIVIDKELLRKSWYIKHLRDHYDELYKRSQSEFDAYEVELKKFEQNTERYTKPKTEMDKQDLLKIQKSFMNLVNSFVYKNEDHNFYVTFEIEDEKSNEKIAPEYTRIPEGLAFRLSKTLVYDTNYVLRDFIYTPNNEKDYYHNFITDAYYMMYLYRANYLMNLSQLNEAENYVKKAITVRNNDNRAQGLMRKIQELKSVK